MSAGRFLLVNQFYPPDPAPTGQMLHAVACELVRRGHEVEVVCSRGAYSGGPVQPPAADLDGVRVRRVLSPSLGRARMGGRVLDAGAFAALVLAGAVRRRPLDVVVSLTTPPYVGLVARAVAARTAARHAHWVMDLYPDVLQARGWLAREGAVRRALDALARAQWRGAAAIVCPGDRLAARLRAYVDEGATVHSVPLWGPAPPDPAQVARMRAGRGWREEPFVLLMSGNVGPGHRIAEFLEAAVRLGPTGPLWAFVGSGVRCGEVERVRDRARIFQAPSVPGDLVAASLAAADVHLIGLEPGWQGLIVPSKLQASFAVGRAVLFVGPRDCEVADWIEESGGGWIVAPGDVEGVLRAVEAAGDPGERSRRGRRAADYAADRFPRARAVARIAGLFEGALAR